jgi:hypothetical protein
LVDITIEASTNAPPAPEFYNFAGKPYRISCGTVEGDSENTGLHREVQLTIYFNPDIIQEGAVVYLVSFHPEKGWVRQEAIGVINERRLSAMIDYLGTVAVIHETNVPAYDPVPTETVIPLENEEPSHVKEILILVGMGVAATGTITVTTTAIIKGFKGYRLK